MESKQLRLAFFQDPPYSYECSETIGQGRGRWDLDAEESSDPDSHNHSTCPYPGMYIEMMMLVLRVVKNVRYKMVQVDRTANQEYLWSYTMELLVEGQIRYFADAL